MKTPSAAKPLSALAAARKILAAVNRRSCNGWIFWEYEATPGHWLTLDTLRK